MFKAISVPVSCTSYLKKTKLQLQLMNGYINETFL